MKDSEITKGGTLKDQNLLKIMRDETLMVMQKGDRLTIQTQIMNDIIFLCDHNLMDYSLLVIVETNPAWIEREKKRAEKNKKKPKDDGIAEVQF